MRLPSARSFLLLTALTAFACGGRDTTGSRPEAAAVRTGAPPSVLLITVDTLRPDALGWIGATNTTPAIDRLAADAFRFPAAVAPVPLTFPSHAAMMTGVLPRRLGLRDNGQTLGSEPRTLAEALRGRGLVTAAFVSGFPLARAFGLDRGFEIYDDRFSAGEGASLERPASETTDAALEWLSSAPAPWFLWVHYYDPHYPYEPPPDLVRRGARGAYEGEVAFVDRAIGELLAGAESVAGGALLTVFAADHGESLGEHGEGTHGFFIYDSTMLVPLLFRFPGAVRPGESGAPARLVDLTPTVLELVGAPALPDADGISLASTIGGGAQEIPPAYLETYQPWLSYGWAPLAAVRDERWKFISAPRSELYDLAADPDETTNVLDENRRLARILQGVQRAVVQRPPVGTAGQTIDAEAAAKLRALGYVGGTSAGEPPASGLRDPKDAAELRELLTEADVLMRAGDAEGAVPKFEAVLARDPGNRFALVRSGVALLALNDLDRAVPRLVEAVRASPEQPEVRTALAQALMRAGRAEEAVPHSMEAARLQPRRAIAWAELGTALGLAGRTGEAVKALQRAVAIEPRNPKLVARLAFAEHAAGRIAEAASHLERTAALEGDGFAYPGSLGILLADLGRDDEARHWLERSRSGEGDFAEARLRLARLEADRGEIESARRALAEAVAASPALRNRVRNDPKLAGLL